RDHAGAGDRAGRRSLVPSAARRPQLPRLEKLGSRDRIRSPTMRFKKDKAPKEPREGRQSKVPEGLWVKCENCRQILYNKELARNFKICPKCGFHFRLSAPERLRMLFDDEKYVEHDANLRSMDPLKFRDTKKYRDRLRDAEEQVGTSDAIVVGSG